MEGVARELEAIPGPEFSTFPDEDALLGELRTLEAMLATRGATVSVMLQRIGKGDPDDRAVLLQYCRDCAELERRSRGCGNEELVRTGQVFAARARKIAGLLKSSGSPNGPERPAPAAGISGSVGRGGKNQPADVARVQTLLAGKGHGVAADGRCGPATIAAIMAFQRAHVGVADGLVEPGRNTWRALNGAAPVQGSPGRGSAPREKRTHELEQLGGAHGAYPERTGQKLGGPHGAAQQRAGEQRLSGDVYSSSDEDGELKILSGSLEGSEHGGSASGAVLQNKRDGVTDTIGQFEVKQGYFEDGDTWWAGSKAGVAGAKTEVDLSDKEGLPEGLVLKGDMGVGTAGMDAWVSDEGAALGAQANVAEVSATLGTQGTGDGDGTVRVGFSEGAGLAGRVHWGDSDKDGNPEYGVGGDVGPVSFDIKTEDPLRWVSEQGPAGPLNAIANQFNEGNQTNDALSVSEDAGRSVGGFVRSAGEFASELLGGDES